MSYTDLRIRRRDAHNWVIEGFDPGGTIEKGPYAGQEKAGGWNELKPIGFFPTLKDAARRLLDEQIAQAWANNGWSGAELADAIAAAEARVLAVVESVNLDAPASRGSNSGSYVLDITAEQAAEIRDSGSPSKAYVRITGGKRFKRTSDETARNLSPDEAALERVKTL